MSSATHIPDDLHDGIDAPRVDDPPPDLFRTYSTADLAARDLRFLWIVKGILCDPTHGQLAGEMKTLKSYLWTLLMVAIATGESFLGRFPVDRPGHVLAYIGEGGLIPYTRRLLRITRAMDVNLKDVPMSTSFDVAPVGSLRFDESLRRDLEQYEPVLFGMDPWYAYHGADVKSSDLHAEGGHLNSVRTPVDDAGASLLIVNHFNQTGSGTGLKRITQAGSGEWADSWFLTSHREPPDVLHGRFQLLLEVGSRQWGGTSWEIDLDIGRFDADLGLHDGEITWDIRPADRDTITSAKEAKKQKARLAIVRVLTDHPFEFTRTEIAEKVGGNKQTAAEAFDHLAEIESIYMEKRKRPEGDRNVSRNLWGARIGADALDDAA